VGLSNHRSLVGSGLPRGRTELLLCSVCKGNAEWLAQALGTGAFPSLGHLSLTQVAVPVWIEVSPLLPVLA
jgi:hypothetical protein